MVDIDSEIECWFKVEYGSDYKPTKEEFEQIKKEYMEFWGEEYGKDGEKQC